MALCVRYIWQGPDHIQNSVKTGKRGAAYFYDQIERSTQCRDFDDLINPSYRRFHNRLIIRLQMDQGKGADLTVLLTAPQFDREFVDHAFVGQFVDAVLNRAARYGKGARQICCRCASVSGQKQQELFVDIIQFIVPSQMGIK